jgi:hypothetical protein
MWNCYHFLFLQIFANDQRQATAVARGIIQRKSVEHHEIDGDEGESVDNKDLAKHVVAIPQLVELFVRMPCTFVL